MAGICTQLVVLSVALFADTAAACSVCFSSTEETRWAYYGTTALMALVPFLFVAAIAVWLRRSLRAQRLISASSEAVARRV